jgi:hypothetical protein
MRQLRIVTIAGCLAAVAGGCAVIGCAGGQVVSYQGYGGTAIVSTDGRTITVGEFGASSCGATVKAVARESATRVALFLRFSTPRKTPTFCMHVGVAAGVITSQKIRLRAPLGSRKLVDGRTGRATAWISARLVLRPTRLPPGYRLAKLIPAADHAPAQSPGPPGCTQIYQSPKKDSWLEIIQTAGKLPRSETPPGGGHPIRVRGHPGHASRNVITWREDGLTDYIRMIGAQIPQDLPQLLTTQQLIAIAESAPQSS